MIHQTNDYSFCAKQDTSAVDIDLEQNITDSSLASTGKPTAVWESPDFEEFDLCMEVTAYVYQWE